MLVGAPKEIKDHEYRAVLTPDSANEVVLHGHDVIVQQGAGIGADDADYVAVGAKVAAGAEEIFERADSSHRPLMFVPRISPKSSRTHASRSASRCRSRASRSWLSSSGRTIVPNQHGRLRRQSIRRCTISAVRVRSACKMYGSVVGMFPQPAQ